MLRKLLKNKKAQNVAEYALLIALVVAGVVAMQTYAQRALQAKIRDASALMTDQVGIDMGLGNTAQYEPYYLKTTYEVDTEDTDTQKLISNTTRQEVLSNRIRKTGGEQLYQYDNALFNEAF